MEYLNLIDRYREEMIETLRTLVSFRSVADKPALGAPFGMGVAEAFDYMMIKAETDGFECDNIDDYGGHIDYKGYFLDEEGNIEGSAVETLGILGHLDVVPEGGDWTYPPFAGEIHDGKMYGRGTMDDKGPVVACYYAMKALKDSGFVPEKNVRLILGLDEETNWKGMEYYLSKVAPPDFGFTPDADFPAIHGEMGLIVYQIAKKIGKSTGKGTELRSIKGGQAPNMVADSVRVVLKSEKAGVYDEIREKAKLYKKNRCQTEGDGAYGGNITCKGIGKSLEIVATGVSAHGATPQLGVNAISVMMSFLQDIDLANDDIVEFIKFYNEKIGFNLNGENIGCGFADEPSGKLIFNVGEIQLDGEALILTVNIRYPVTSTENQIYEGIMPHIDKAHMGIIKGKMRDPIYMSEDEPMIKKLMEVYQKHTGDMETKPLVIGGGTYARAAKNIVAFGPLLPGDEELAHQKDEYIDLDKFIQMTKIYADAIYTLTAPAKKGIEEHVSEK